MPFVRANAIIGQVFSGHLKPYHELLFPFQFGAVGQLLVVHI